MALSCLAAASVSARALPPVLEWGWSMKPELHEEVIRRTVDDSPRLPGTLHRGHVDVGVEGWRLAEGTATAVGLRVSIEADRWRYNLKARKTEVFAIECQNLKISFEVGDVTLDLPHSFGMHVGWKDRLARVEVSRVALSRTDMTARLRPHFARENLESKVRFEGKCQGQTQLLRDIVIAYLTDLIDKEPKLLEDLERRIQAELQRSFSRDVSQFWGRGRDIARDVLDELEPETEFDVTRKGGLFVFRPKGTQGVEVLTPAAQALIPAVAPGDGYLIATPQIFAGAPRALARLLSESEETEERVDADEIQEVELDVNPNATNALLAEGQILTLALGAPGEPFDARFWLSKWGVHRGVELVFPFELRVRDRAGELVAGRKWRLRWTIALEWDASLHRLKVRGGRIESLGDEAKVVAVQMDWLMKSESTRQLLDNRVARWLEIPREVRGADDLDFRLLGANDPREGAEPSGGSFAEAIFLRRPLDVPLSSLPKKTSNKN